MSATGFRERTIRYDVIDKYAQWIKNNRKKIMENKNASARRGFGWKRVDCLNSPDRKKSENRIKGNRYIEVIQ